LGSHSTWAAGLAFRQLQPDLGIVVDDEDVVLAVHGYQSNSSGINTPSRPAAICCHALASGSSV